MPTRNPGFTRVPGHHTPRNCRRWVRENPFLFMIFPLQENARHKTPARVTSTNHASKDENICTHHLAAAELDISHQWNFDRLAASGNSHRCISFSRGRSTRRSYVYSIQGPFARGPGIPWQGAECRPPLHLIAARSSSRRPFGHSRSCASRQTDIMAP